MRDSRRDGIELGMDIELKSLDRFHQALLVRTYKPSAEGTDARKGQER
jgi:hypothetical protein